MMGVSPELKIEGKSSMATAPDIAVRAEMIMWRLNRLLGKSVAHVDVRFDVQKHVHIVTIRFQNGLAIEATENEINSEEFHARCIMIYDLPS